MRAPQLIAVPPRLIIAKTPSETAAAVGTLRNGRILAVDTETTGLDWTPQRDLVGGISFAAGTVACYCYGDGLGPAVEWLADEVKHQRELVFHNAKFDLHHLHTTFGLRIAYPVDDTYLMSFLDDNRGAPLVGTHQLKELAAAYVDPAAKEPRDELLDSVRRNGGKNEGDYLLGDPELLGRYGAMDAWYTLQLYARFAYQLKTTQRSSEAIQSIWELYETERWLLLALVAMEERGVRVDTAFLERWRTQLVKDLALTERKLFAKVGHPVDWRSHYEVRRLLFTERGNETLNYTRGGEASTDEATLLRLHDPAAPLILKLRELDKMRSTYAENVLNAIKADGRVHCQFKQTGAETGRLSASEPNLQNQGRESGIRKAYVPDDGLNFYFADYSQIEMRFGAHYSNDPTLIKGFRTNPKFDTHFATAQKMYGIPEPSKRQRKFAKIMNFAMLYGAGIDKIESQLVTMLQRTEAVHAITEFGIARDKSESPHRQLAGLLIERYFTEFPAVKRTRYALADRCRSLGYTINLFGRRRYLEEDVSYRAFNTLVQGSAADQAKRGLVALYRELQCSGDIALVLQIHDEAVYLAENAPKLHRRVLELLADTKTFRVPLVASLDWSRTSWQEKVLWTPSSR